MRVSRIADPRCSHVAGTGARCIRSPRHDGAHAYSDSWQEPRNDYRRGAVTGDEYLKMLETL